MPRYIKWAIVVTLDVKNAFNTIRWSCIRQELRDRGIKKYLQNVIGNYLSERSLVVDRGCVIEIKASVPQGSILGPTLWNIVYDGVLRLDWPNRVKAVGFADDVALVAEADSEAQLQVKLESALDMIMSWMAERGLELTLEKTEVVVIR